MVCKCCFAVLFRPRAAGPFGPCRQNPFDSFRIGSNDEGREAFIPGENVFRAVRGKVFFRVSRWLSRREQGSSRPLPSRRALRPDLPEEALRACPSSCKKFFPIDWNTGISCPMEKKAAPRIAIVDWGYGEGHNSAARGVRDALAGRAEVRVTDLCAEAMPRMFRLTRAAYLWIISRLPRLWKLMYEGERQAQPGGKTRPRGSLPWSVFWNGCCGIGSRTPWSARTWCIPTCWIPWRPARDAVPCT